MNITDIILENQGLIYKIINKYKNYFELDDLYQVAVMGLIKAYRNYRSNYNAKFTSYAYPYILGEVIKYISEFRNVKVNKNTSLLYSKILMAKDVLAQKLMKEPSTYELSLFLEIDERVISDTIMNNMVTDSLDRIIQEDGRNFVLYDKLGYDDVGIKNYSLIQGIERLSPEERKIIVGRYYQDMSQKEVGDSLGMYQVEVSRKEKKILQKLKDSISV